MADETPAPAVEEEEKPNVPRIIALAVLLLGVTGWLIYARFINPPPEAYVLDANGARFYTQLPGIDTTGLTPDQLQAVLKWANHTPCGCGLNHCTMQLAECRNNDEHCHVSLGKVGLMVDMVKHGQPVFPDGQAPTPAPPPGAPRSPAPAASSSAVPSAAGSTSALPAVPSGQPQAGCCGSASPR